MNLIGTCGLVIIRICTLFYSILENFLPGDGLGRQDCYISNLIGATCPVEESTLFFATFYCFPSLLRYLRLRSKIVYLGILLHTNGGAPRTAPFCVVDHGGRSHASLIRVMPALFSLQLPGQPFN